MRLINGRNNPFFFYVSASLSQSSVFVRLYKTGRRGAHVRDLLCDRLAARVRVENRVPVTVDSAEPAGRVVGHTLCRALCRRITTSQ